VVGPQRRSTTRPMLGATCRGASRDTVVVTEMPFTAEKKGGRGNWNNTHTTLVAFLAFLSKQSESLRRPSFHILSAGKRNPEGESNVHRGGGRRVAPVMLPSIVIMNSIAAELRSTPPGTAGILALPEPCRV
jgi:hypothetical protein